MIPLVWRGLGYLVPLSVAAAVAITIYLPINQKDGKLTNMVVYIVAAVLCLVAGVAVEAYRRSTSQVHVIRNERTGKEKKSRVVFETNTTTGEKFMVVVKDTFFGIPILYWGIILAAWSVYVYQVN